MLALLKLVPIKDWCYGAAIVALLIGFAVFTHHERVVGAAKVHAADARAAAAQVAHNTEVESHAQKSQTAAVENYVQQVATPVVPPAPILCFRSSHGGAMSNHAGAPSGGHGATVLPSESTVDIGRTFNPAPAILKNDEQADAQVTLLQALIRSYQNAGVVSK